MKQHIKLPDIVSGYVLNNGKSFFSVVVPEDGLNLAKNPELFDYELESTFYSDTFVTSYSDDYEDTHYGYKSMRILFSSGMSIYNPILTQLLETEPVTLSVSIKGTGKVKLYLAYYDEGLFTTTIIGGYSEYELNDEWTRISHTIGSLPTSIISPRMYIEASIDSDIKISAWQCEKVPYMTTFISGNQKSIFDENGYIWMGAINNSVSIRKNTVLDGGKVINLKDLGFHLEGFTGLGLPQFDYNNQPLSTELGSINLGRKLENREFVLIGKIFADNVNDYLHKRNELNKIFNQSIIRFIFQLVDCDTASSKELTFTAVYSNGMEGDYTNLYGEALSITFTMFDPYIYITGNKIHKLLSNNELNAMTISKNVVGEWRNMLTPITSGAFHISKLKVLRNNLVYGVGLFVFTYDGENYSLIGAPTANALEYNITVPNIYTIKETINGNVYLGGDMQGFDLYPLSTISFPPPSPISSVVRRGIVHYNYETHAINPIGEIEGIVYTIEYIQHINKLLIAGKFNSYIPEGGSSTPLTDCKNLVLYNLTTGQYEQILFSSEAIIDEDQIIYASKYYNGNVLIGGAHCFKLYDTVNNKLVSLNDNPTSLVYFGYNTNVTGSISNPKTARINCIEISKSGEIFVGGYFDAHTAPSTSSTYYTRNGTYSLAKYKNNRLTSIGLIASVPPLFHSSEIEASGATDSVDREGANYGVGIIHDMTFNEKDELIFVGEFNHINNNPGLYGTGLTPQIGIPIELCQNGEYKPNCYGIAKYSNGILSNYEISVDNFEEKEYCLFTAITSGNNTITNYNTYIDSLLNSPVNKETLFIAASSYQKFAPTTIYTGITAIPQYNVSDLLDNGYLFRTPNTDLLINEGEKVFPIIEVYGTGQIQTLLNYSTNGRINLVNKLLNPNEILKFDFNKLFEIITSSTGYDQSYYITNGTFFSNFYLQNNKNYLSSLWINDPNASLFIRWIERYLTIDGV